MRGGVVAYTRGLTPGGVVQGEGELPRGQTPVAPTPLRWSSRRRAGPRLAAGYRPEPSSALAGSGARRFAGTLAGSAGCRPDPRGRSQVRPGALARSAGYRPDPRGRSQVRRGTLARSAGYRPYPALHPRVSGRNLATSPAPIRATIPESGRSALCRVPVCGLCGGSLRYRTGPFAGRSCARVLCARHSTVQAVTRPHADRQSARASSALA